MTTTNPNEKENIIPEVKDEKMPIIGIAKDDDAVHTKMPAFENPNCPVADELVETASEDVDVENIDIACDMVNNAAKNRNDDIAKEQENAEKQKKEYRDKMLENQRIASRNESIEKAKAARRARKKLAKNLTFTMAIISALCSTVVIGILIWILFDVSEWLFAGIVGAIGMLNTLIHTYMYRYIREEIFRK